MARAQNSGGNWQRLGDIAARLAARITQINKPAGANLETRPPAAIAQASDARDASDPQVHCRTTASTSGAPTGLTRIEAAQC